MKRILLSLLGIGLSTCLYASPKKAKNIILLIGDGFGPQQYSMGLIYAHQSPKSPYKKSGLSMEKLMKQGETGFMMTYPKGSIVVDSAASATQLATGHFAASEMIGVDFNGNKRETILEMAQKAGKSTGLVSNTRLTHATPASFAAHVPHRSLEYLIAEQMLATGPTVMLSGGLRYFLPDAVNDKSSAVYKRFRKSIPKHVKLQSRRGDEKDLISEATRSGYKVVYDNAALNKVKSGKVLGLFGSSAMPNAINEKKSEKDPKRKVPTLADMTKKALQILDKDKDGFFLMVEGGQIDWAGHANDAGTMLHEIIQYDKAIGEVYKYAKSRKDTLVVMVSDHETGSFGFSYSRNDIPKPKKLKGNAFQDQLFKPNFNFGDPNVLDKIYAQKTSLYEVIVKFNSLPKDKQTAKELHKRVNDAIEFPFSLAEAKRVLELEDNPYQIPGHKYLDKKKFPKFGTFREYYVYGLDSRANLIGHMIAKEQQVVWGTGTHTTTFVPVVSWGVNQEMFKGLHHSTEVGRNLMKSFGFKAKYAATH